MAAKLASLYGLRDRQVHTDAATFVKSVAAAVPELFPWRESSDTIDSASAEMLLESLGTYLRNSFEAHVLAKIKGTPLPSLGFDLELFKQFHRTYKKGMKMKPNILVCGKTGVGKTSLIQAVTHRGVVPDSAIGDGKPITVGFQVYETEAANFIDSEGMNPGRQTVDEYADFILDELLQRLNTSNQDKLIHNIWYCIDGSGARIQDTDVKLIKTFSDKVVLVVTKCELMRKEQVESVMNTLLDLIDRDRIVLVSSENRTGLKQLIARTETMSAAAMGRASEEQEAFRNRWDNYYSNMRRAWTESQRRSGQLHQLGGGTRGGDCARSPAACRCRPVDRQRGVYALQTRGHLRHCGGQHGYHHAARLCRRFHCGKDRSQFPAVPESSDCGGSHLLGRQGSESLF